MAKMHSSLLVKVPSKITPTMSPNLTMMMGMVTMRRLKPQRLPTAVVICRSSFDKRCTRLVRPTMQLTVSTRSLRV